MTSHGLVDGKRHAELVVLFNDSGVRLALVSTFPDRRTFTRYAEAISWKTKVWVADNLSHLIHFNGVRFLAPHLPK